MQEVVRERKGENMRYITSDRSQLTSDVDT